MQYRIDLLWQAQEGTRLTLCKTRIKDLGQFECYAATLGITKKRVFILDVPPAVEILQSQLKKFRGLEIQAIHDTQNVSLVIILLEDTLFSTFCYLVDDIVNSLMPLSSAKEAVDELFKVVRQWKRLFDNTHSQGLSIEEQKGLYGELLMLRCLLIANFSGNDVLIAWQGPDKKNQDFMFENLCIEVKATTANTPVIRISSENQLSCQKVLCLVLYALSETRGNTNTLPVLVDEIRQILTMQKEEMTGLFDDKLILYGYNETDRSLYSNADYSVRFTESYLVTEEFPKIIPGNVASGVFQIGYHIERSACTQFTVNYPDFITEELNR